MEFNYEKLSANVKKALKVKGMTYSELALKIGMTESGIKKLLSSKDCSINRLAQISDAMEISLKDLIESCAEMKVINHTYTVDQEEFFLKNEGYFYFFWELRNHQYDIEKLRTSYKLTDKSIQKYLLKLDSIGVIELHENNKIKPVIEKADRGNWEGNTQLAKKMIPTFKKGLFEHSLNILGSGKYTKEDISHQMNLMSLREESFKELNNDLRAVIRKYSKKAHKEKILSKESELISIGTLAIAVPFEFKNTLVINNI